MTSLKLSQNVVFSIVVLSLIVNFLALPLYNRADRLQDEERERQAQMKPWIDHFKKAFSGDERFMIQSYYYKQVGYKSVYALRGALSTILQVPFFIAAYRFLSNCYYLSGVSFGPIRDMGVPDAILIIGSHPVNVLPIIMTAINVISGLIYTKGQPIKEKIQLFGIAALFLVLLYRSPSGLVFYWILNQVFSLIKNIVLKLLPVHARRQDTKADYAIAADKTQQMLFWTSGVFAAVLIGIYIPSNVIKASVAEFVYYRDPHNPANYLFYAFLYAVGVLCWFSVFYYISDFRGRRRISVAMTVMSVVAVVDYFFFGTDLGLISANLQYNEHPYYDIKQKTVNLLVLAGVSLIVILINRKWPVAEQALIVAALSAVLIICMINIHGINSEYSKLHYEDMDSMEDVRFSFSRNGKNVMLIMLDRAMGTQLPYIMNEKPELMDKFDGFTYYSDTVSFGAFTNFGSPALYGGYEYTPARMNARDDTLLKDKHDEALKVLPILFEDAGYDVTVCDPTYAGYQWTSDLSIYGGYEKIHAYTTEGMFSQQSDESRESDIPVRRRNFFAFSLMKASPLVLNGMIYDDGLYNTRANGTQVEAGISMSKGYFDEFMKWYWPLEHMSDMTEFSDGDDNHFIMLENCSTHEPMKLSEPDYIPAPEVDNTAYDVDMVNRYTLDGVTMHMENNDQVDHYHVNMAALIQLGKWFDHLRENGVYDNTRIVIVADHGRNLDQFDLTLDDGTDVECFMPLLMVKDYDAVGFTVSDEFMTNADVPSILVSDLISNPRNPFSDNPLDAHEKAEQPVEILYSDQYDISKNNGYRFMEGRWYTVHGDIHDKNDWEYLGTR